MSFVPGRARRCSSVGLGDGGQLLIAGHDADHPVSRLHQGVEHMVVGAGGAVGGHQFLRADRAVQLAHALPEGRGALDIAIGQAPGAEGAEKVLPLHAAQLEQRVQGHGIHAGLGDVEARVIFVLVHPLLHGKGLDVHGKPPSIWFAFCLRRGSREPAAKRGRAGSGGRRARFSRGLPERAPPPGRPRPRTTL